MAEIKVITRVQIKLRFIIRNSEHKCYFSITTSNSLYCIARTDVKVRYAIYQADRRHEGIKDGI